MKRLLFFFLATALLCCCCGCQKNLVSLVSISNTAWKANLGDSGDGSEGSSSIKFTDTGFTFSYNKTAPDSLTMNLSGQFTYKYPDITLSYGSGKTMTGTMNSDGMSLTLTPFPTLCYTRE